MTFGEEEDLPFRYFTWPIAGSCSFAENLASFATRPARSDAVDAHVEVLAVFRIGVTWMGYGYVIAYGRASEVKHLCTRNRRKK